MNVAPIITPLAAAVTQELRSPVSIPEIDFTAWSQPFGVERTYNPSLKLETANGPLLSVMAGKVRGDVSDRDTLSPLCDVLIYLRSAVTPRLEVVDSLVNLLEEINRYFFSLPDKRLTAYNQGLWNGYEILPVFTARIRDEQEYRGVLTLTFQVFDRG